VAALACLLGPALFQHGEAVAAPARTVAESAHSVQFDALSRREVDALAVDANVAEAPVGLETPRSLLKPVEQMHDGNVCADNEELFEGLCYHKCSLLTLGKETIRSTPWSCCAAEPCIVPSHEAVEVGTKPACSGFDVSGTGGCPHKPGACLTDEELHLGQCYKRCDVLTNGQYPHRLAAMTCCKTDRFMGCLNFRNVETRPSFAVGGGAGDHDPSTPAQVHAPDQSLTEEASGAEASPNSVAAAAVSPQSRPESLLVLDGSRNCSIIEELYGGLCYRKCNLLTYGEYPIRTSSWSCCANHPCGIMNQKGSVGTAILCNGYDVSGDGKCPRAPGGKSCAPDEEDLLGVCYRKCALLTKGEAPHRVAAATCCKTQDRLGCLDVFKNDVTSDSFDVGSGIAAQEPSFQQAAKVTASSGPPAGMQDAWLPHVDLNHEASAFMMKKK